jgi:predicted DNA-binding transcriptional regulator YafY
MAKADQMLALLRLLGYGQRKTARQLAEALEVNIRTVYRYIDALCASGVPIVAEAGHNGGYRLLESFKETPLFFDADEQKAIIHAAKFAQEAGYPNGEELERAIAKLKTYNNPEQLSAVTRLAESVEVVPPTVEDVSLQETLQHLERSAAEGRTLEIDYCKAYASAVETRRFDPYGLVYWKGAWYSVGYCHLREDIRSFRADRMTRVAPTDASFERPPHFAPKQYFLQKLLPSRDRAELVSVRIQGKSHALNDLCKHWFFGHALVERTEAEALFQFEKQSLHGHAVYYLLTYGGSLRVTEPPSLKETLIRIASGLLDYYRSM